MSINHHVLPANAPLPHGEERIRAARQRGPVRVSNHLARCGVANDGVKKPASWLETHIDSARALAMCSSP